MTFKLLKFVDKRNINKKMITSASRAYLVDVGTSLSSISSFKDDDQVKDETQQADRQQQRRRRSIVQSAHESNVSYALEIVFSCLFSLLFLLSNFYMQSTYMLPTFYHNFVQFRFTSTFFLMIFLLKFSFNAQRNRRLYK